MLRSPSRLENRHFSRCRVVPPSAWRAPKRRAYADCSVPQCRPVQLTNRDGSGQERQSFLREWHGRRNRMRNAGSTLHRRTATTPALARIRAQGATRADLIYPSNEGASFFRKGRNQRCWKISNTRQVTCMSIAFPLCGSPFSGCPVRSKGPLAQVRTRYSIGELHAGCTCVVRGPADPSFPVEGTRRSQIG